MESVKEEGEHKAQLWRHLVTPTSTALITLFTISHIKRFSSKPLSRHGKLYQLAKRPILQKHGERAHKATKEEEVIAVLQDLTKYFQDCDNGFKEAAGEVKNPELKHLFVQRASALAAAAAQFHQEISRRGGDPETSSPFTGRYGDIYRGCVDLRWILVGKNDEAVLDEVERTGDHALTALRDARERMTKLGLDNADLAYTVVEYHLQEIERSQHEVKFLRDVIRAQA